MESGCIGKKLGHSFSKEIHNALTDYTYELCEIPEDKLDEFMKKRDFKAINVTIPYKEKVIEHLDYISDEAKTIGAVNTIVNKNGVLHGYNTDFSRIRGAFLHTNSCICVASICGCTTIFRALDQRRLLPSKVLLQYQEQCPKR